MSFPFGQYVHNGAGTGQSRILENINIDRIGVQAIAGTPIEINGEQFVVGRTGALELETTVTSVRIDNSKKYIIDYHIKEA